jgi:hypothetical protein
MFKAFFDLFKPGDIALGDRAFCSFASMATLLLRSVDSVFRERGRSYKLIKEGRPLRRLCC